MDIDETSETIKNKGIEYVALQFTDVLGKFYALWIPSAEVDVGLTEGVSVSGYPYIADHEISDILLKPAVDTFRILPWSNNGRNVGSIICDIYPPDSKKELEESPRFLLKRAVGKLKKEIGEDVNIYVAPEWEFFLVERSEDGGLRLHDQGSYFSPPPIDKAHKLREDICYALDQMGIHVVKQHHESLRGKHEINIKFDKALNMADKVQLGKLVIRKFASDQGLIATFMPKPFNVPAGAGWHTHVSLMDERKGNNLFYDRDGKHGFSNLGLHFIAGVLKHAKALAAISNSTVNSYKRLVPGYQAPIYVCWARYNRSTLIRIPATPPNGTRFEYRASDGLSNYYLFFAALIYAGLDGIAEEESLPPPTEENVYLLKQEEKLKRRIESLPGSLKEALEELERDEIIKSALGSLAPKFLRLKHEEWQEYSHRVHEWERQKYLEEQFTRYAEFRETGDRVVL